MTKKENNIILFSITLCWASSYVFIKDLPADLSPYAYLTLTSGIAGILLLIIFHRVLLHIDRPALVRGAVLSGLIAANMLLEKAGLEQIPSSTASFIASLNIVMVPLILLAFRQFPTRNNVAGMAVILGGLAVSSGFTIADGGSVTGALYMLAACAAMSLYTVIAADFTKKSNPLALSVLQICFSALIGFALWFFEDPGLFRNVAWSNRMLSSIFILAFFSKAYAYIMLMYAEKYADAISVTIIASTEPIVTFVLALLIPNAQGDTEKFSPWALAGAVLIASGAFIAGSDFLSPQKAAPSAALNPGGASPAAGAMERPLLHEPARPRYLYVKQFFLTMIPFAVLGAVFKVMVLVEGFTEVRPANAIPALAGMLFGPVGALGCAAGNLVADCFGSLNATSLLGIAANFTAAYLPSRVWGLLRREWPNIHTWKNLSLYLWISFLSALSCAWILGFGLEVFFGIWIEDIYKDVFLNNFGFSMALGVPLFALATSDSFHLHMWKPSQWNNPFMPRNVRAFRLLQTMTLVFSALALGVWRGFHLSNSTAMCVLSLAAAVLLAVVCFLPNGRTPESGESP